MVASESILQSGCNSCSAGAQTCSQEPRGEINLSGDVERERERERENERERDVERDVEVQTAERYA